MNPIEDFIDGAITAASLTLFLLFVWSIWQLGGNTFLFNWGPKDASLQDRQSGGAMDTRDRPIKFHGI